MPQITIIYGEETKTIEAPAGMLLGDVITQAELPLEQPCAGRGTCGKCKVLVEDGASPPDDIEQRNLSAGELALGTRLACRARVETKTRLVLSPLVVYSDKIFKADYGYTKNADGPFGLAVDLGTTTVAAFLTRLMDGTVCAGAAVLNQQAIYGADVISRLNAALHPDDAQRLQRLALASIHQAIEALKLPKSLHSRLERVTVVGNSAMHHLLVGLPVDSLAVLPFQPRHKAALRDAAQLFGGIFPSGMHISLPPLIGGFVGSDALACLAYFGFDHPPCPMAAIDLGTNGEVMVTNGKDILVASTAAGPAFEGVNISCGSRAVDGAAVRAQIDAGEIFLQTIADAPPIGLTGSGLLGLVNELRHAGLIESSGRIARNSSHPLARRIKEDENGTKRIQLTADGKLYLSQFDIRELQKAKAAIRAACDILLARLGLKPEDLGRVILTGSFGGQVDVQAALELGMLPPVRPEIVENISNGAGLGAALFLSDEGFARGERLAEQARQVNLDADANFQQRYVNAMRLE